jgi:hypothetical protein
VSLYQLGAEALLADAVGDHDLGNTIVFFRIFWLVGNLYVGSVAGPTTKKTDEIIPSLALAMTGVWVVAGAMAWAGIWVVAGADVGVVAGAGALAGGVAVAWVRTLGGVEAGIGTLAGVVAGAAAWTVTLAGAVAWSFLGTELLLNYLWVITHPKNPHRRSDVMFLSLGGGLFCFSQATAKTLLPGIVLGAGNLGIIGLVVAMLVGTGKWLRSETSLEYGGRWGVMTLPIILGLVLGWQVYRVLPWGDWIVHWMN